MRIIVVVNEEEVLHPDAGKLSLWRVRVNGNVLSTTGEKPKEAEVQGVTSAWQKHLKLRLLKQN